MDNKIFVFLRKISQVLLLFLGVYSSIMCTVTRLEISINDTITVIALLIFSFAIWGIFSFLDDIPHGKWIAVAVGVFLLGISWLRFGAAFVKGMTYTANSFLKLAMTYYNIKLELFSYSSNAETVSTSYSATVFVILFGMVLLFLLSINFYKKRKAAMYLLCTIPLFILPYFVGRVGAYKDSVIYLASVAAVFASGHAGSGVMETKVREKVSLLLTGMALLCALVGYLVYSPVRYEENKENFITVKKDFQEMTKWSAGDLADWVKASFSADAIDYGAVGQKDKVTFNGKKLLEIQPGSIQIRPLYLKGFIGDKYDNGRWTFYRSEDQEYTKQLNQLRKDTGGSPDSWSNLIAEAIARTNSDGENFWTVESTIKVKNITMGRGRKVVPYYPVEEVTYEDGNVQWSGGFNYSVNFLYKMDERLRIAFDKHRSFNFLSGSDSLADKKMKGIREKMNSFVTRYYLELPEGMKEKTLSNFLTWCSKKGIGEDSSIEKKIRAIRQYLTFSDNYEYSLAPGKTPKGKDSIDYFLNENYKGYCVHYASAAAMMLRSLGVPTRFAEGVYVPEDKVEQYFSKHNEYIAVLDEDAHAWVEVYGEDSGFVPVDFTPGHTETDGKSDGSNTDQENVANHDNLSVPTPEPTTQSEETATQPPEENMEFDDIEHNDDNSDSLNEDEGGGSESSSDNSGIGGIGWGRIVILILIILGIPVSLHGQWMIRQKVYVSQLRKKTTRGRIVKMHFHMKPLLASRHCPYEGEPVNDYTEKLKKELGLKDGQVRPYVTYLMKAEFDHEITKEELTDFKKSYRTIRSKIVKEASFVKKLIFRYIFNQ